MSIKCGFGTSIPRNSNRKSVLNLVLWSSTRATLTTTGVESRRSPAKENRLYLAIRRRPLVGYVSRKRKDPIEADARRFGAIPENCGIRSREFRERLDRAYWFRAQEVCRKSQPTLNNT